MFGHIFRISLRTSVLALGCATLAGPAFASTPYDGDWSVVISTQSGTCEPSIRYGLQIENGMVIAGGGNATVQGRVSPAGNVKVLVQSGGSSADGSGHLGRTRGAGVWRGQGTSGACQGTWMAERRGYPGQAETSGPIYTYASAPAVRATAPVRASVLACEERFRSYSPATGTYLGYDGMRHPCP